VTLTSTILIVDDELGGRKTLELILRPYAYDLVFASTGAEALAQATSRLPDLILLDVMMPGMDGFEVCRRVRADARLAEIPVIMLTALDDRASRLEGIKSGADDFLSKPYDRTELRARVQTITRLNRYRRLLTERAKFAWVIDHAAGGFLIVSATDQVRYANATARRYLGLPPDTTLPITETFRGVAQKQYHCEPQEAWVSWPDAPSEDVAAQHYLVQPESATAGACWLMVSTLRLPADSDGEWLIQLQDVTAQMGVQSNMWKFQSMVSHKLRTPLIHLFSLDLLANYAAELPLDQITEIATIAVTGARRLRGAIDDILGYISVPNRVTPEAGFPLDQLAELAQTISATVGIATITVACPDGLTHARLTLAPQTIELVLGELLENAKKFHPQHAPAVDVLVFDEQAEMACIQVRDDGLTLTPDQLAQAWTPYYQGEKYFTGEVAGIGLGLARVASIVWAVGGTCRINNRDDRPGVVVELTVPVSH
jgi:two-component system cell cycle response regulator